MQAIPAGLPCGMPGIGVVMEGAVQHAPQPGRHGIDGCEAICTPANRNPTWTGRPQTLP
ncbi:MAG: hypothetical protein WCN85_04325 [Burkholderiales bacterium]